jgi:hypothetical protein
MSEIGRSSPGSQAVTAALMREWHDEISAGVRHMQGRGQDERELRERANIEDMRHSWCRAPAWRVSISGKPIG